MGYAEQCAANEKAAASLDRVKELELEIIKKDKRIVELKTATKSPYAKKIEILEQKLIERDERISELVEETDRRAKEGLNQSSRIGILVTNVQELEGILKKAKGIIGGRLESLYYFESHRALQQYEEYEKRNAHEWLVLYWNYKKEVKERE